MIQKQPQIKDPFLFGEWFDISWFHGCYIDGLTRVIKKRLGYGLSALFAEQEPSVQRIFFSRSEWTDIGQRYLEEVVAKPELLEQLLLDIRTAADELSIFSKELTVKGLSSTAAEQVDILKNFHIRHHLLWALGQVTNVLELENSFLTGYLKDYLTKQGLSGSDQSAAFLALTTPREFSAAQQEERAMLKLATEPEDAAKIHLHWQQFNWVQFGWIGPALNEEYFIEVCKGLARAGNAVKEFATIQARDKMLLENKKMWLDRLASDQNIVKLFRLLEELLFVKAYRMDALFMSYSAIQPTLKKIARDNYLSLDQVYGLYADWIVEFLEKGSIDTDRVSAIRQYSVQYYDGYTTSLLVGEEAKKFAAPLKALLPPLPVVKELKGEGAFPGLVTGPVCIVNRAAEMGKFKDGDVLVSNVTDPSLLPIMKRASAFVTNMGGLTCHAAIVARELHVPCVIGTKIATKILKDGDIVEVNAIDGKVKILNK